MEPQCWELWIGSTSDVLGDAVIDTHCFKLFELLERVPLNVALGGLGGSAWPVIYVTWWL